MANTTERRQLTRFDADASGHIKATKEIGAETQRLINHLGQASKSIVDTFGAMDGAWSRSKKVFADGVAIIEGFQNAHEKYVQRTTQLSQLYAVRLSELDKAAAGTRTQAALLTDAIAYQNGVFKLSQGAMETAILAERKLARQGADLEQVHNAITAALTKGEVDGLRPFGIAVDKAGASMDTAAGRAKIYNALMAELSKLAGDAGLANRTAAEDIAAGAAKNANSLDSIKNSIGGVVDALKPLTSVAADALGGLAELLDQVTNASARQRAEALRARADQYYRDQYDKADAKGKTSYDRSGFSGFIARQTGYDPRVFDSLRMGGPFDKYLFSRQFDEATSTDFVQSTLSPFTGKGKPVAAAAKSTAAARVVSSVQSLQEALAGFASATVANENGPGLGSASALMGRSNYGDLGLGAAAATGPDVLGGDITKTLGDVIGKRQTKNWKDELGNRGKERTSLLESTIGKLGEFDAYKAAWAGLTTSITAGYGAMVDGSMSFGKAFKMAMAESLKATGATMLIEALKETAAGFASLALGPIGGVSAAGHFKAAALYGAGAVAAGVAARGLGSGAGGGALAGGGGSGGGAAPVRSPSMPANGNQSNVVYVVGDPFDTETNPRRRLNNAQKVLRSVSGNTAGGAY